MERGGGCGNADTERALVRGRQSILPRMRIEKFCLGNRAGSALPPLPAHSPLPLRKHAAKESLPCMLVLMRATRVSRGHVCSSVVRPLLTPLCSPWCFLPSPYPLSFSNPYVPALKVGPPEATRTLVSTWQAERPPLTHHADSKALKMQARQSQDTPADKDALSAVGSDTCGGGGSE